MNDIMNHPGDEPVESDQLFKDLAAKFVDHDTRNCLECRAILDRIERERRIQDCKAAKRRGEGISNHQP